MSDYDHYLVHRYTHENPLDGCPFCFPPSPPPWPPWPVLAAVNLTKR
jgi:hypothetical protein